MKRIASLLILVIGLNSVSTAAFADTKSQKQERGNMFVEMGKAAYFNVVDILPFLTTFGLSIIQQQLQPKDNIANPVLAKLLPYASVAIPSAFSLSNLYARVSELRDMRELVIDDPEKQDGITSQQDLAIAKYTFWIPLSILAAFRLASNADASARIGYVLACYVLAASAGTESSPVEILRESVAHLLDSFRKTAPATKQEG